MGADNGCRCYVIRGDPPRVPAYSTRYNIHISSHRLCVDSLLYYYAPCCWVNHRHNFIRRLLRAESFLYLLHLSTVVMASAKEAQDMREHENTEYTHFVLSIVEIVITMCVLVFRMFNAVMGYYEVKAALMYWAPNPRTVPVKIKGAKTVHESPKLSSAAPIKYLAQTPTNNTYNDSGNSRNNSAGNRENTEDAANPELQECQTRHTTEQRTAATTTDVRLTAKATDKTTDVKSNGQNEMSIADNIHLRQMSVYMYAYVAGGILLMAGAILIFVALYYWVNLGWSFMISNFCLITSLVATSLYNARAELSVAQIRSDNYRAVLYETMLMTKQLAIDPPGWSKAAREYRRKLLDTGNLLQTNRSADIEMLSA